MNTIILHHLLLFNPNCTGILSVLIQILILDCNLNHLDCKNHLKLFVIAEIHRPATKCLVRRGYQENICKYCSEYFCFKITHVSRMFLCVMSTKE